LVLVDTSVWISHLRDGRPDLAEVLEAGEAVCHPFVIGELACGHLVKRTEILTLLKALPLAPLVEHEEVLKLIEARKLMAKGLGYVDVHLLASSLFEVMPLWTLDRRLDGVAAQLGLSYRS
jgi:predicted nucleic acid-binding protein